MQTFPLLPVRFVAENDRTDLLQFDLSFESRSNGILTGRPL